jgi:hypothetical protein
MKECKFQVLTSARLRRVSKMLEVKDLVIKQEEDEKSFKYQLRPASQTTIPNHIELM